MPFPLVQKNILGMEADKMTEEEIKKRCKDRGMEYNSMTRLMVLHRKTAYRLSHDLQIPQPTVSRMTHVNEKSMVAWCSALFRVLGKLDAMGYDVFGLF